MFGSATESVLKVAYLEQTNAISTGVLFTGLLGLSGVRCLDADNNGWNDIISSSKNEELIKFHFNHFLKFKTKIISNIGRYRSISLKVKVNSVIIKAASYAKNVIREFILIDKIFSDSFD